MKAREKIKAVRSVLSGILALICFFLIAIVLLWAVAFFVGLGRMLLIWVWS